MDYIFTKKPGFVEPIRVLFLCGTKYSANENDKRNVLKKDLETDPKNRVIILEEFYNFSRSKKNAFLSYYDAELLDLFHIEMLVSCFSSAVIILHESYSTAGEIGAFASNPYIRNKIITIVPERYSVEEEKVSGFLSLAFWNKKKRVISSNIIRFYPITKRVIISDNRSVYHTFFNNNIIPTGLSKNIHRAILRADHRETIIAYDTLRKNVFHREDKTVVHLSFASLKNYIFALYTIKDIRDELRVCKKVYEIIDVFLKWFFRLLENTIFANDGKCGKLQVVLNHQNDLSIKDSISMMVYIMNACNIIRIEKQDDGDIKVHVSKSSVKNLKNYRELVKKQDLKEWGE